MAFNLPSGIGLVIHRSMDRDLAGVRNGAAITKTPDETIWYATDFYVRPQDPPEFGAWTFGPFDTLTKARRVLESSELEELDANGTTGTSTWLTLT